MWDERRNPRVRAHALACRWVPQRPFSGHLKHEAPGSPFPGRGLGWLSSQPRESKSEHGSPATPPTPAGRTASRWGDCRGSLSLSREPLSPTCPDRSLGWLNSASSQGVEERSDSAVQVNKNPAPPRVTCPQVEGSTGCGRGNREFQLWSQHHHELAGWPSPWGLGFLLCKEEPGVPISLRELWWSYNTPWMRKCSMNQCMTQIPNFSPACDLCEQTQGGNTEVKKQTSSPQLLGVASRPAWWWKELERCGKLR